MQKLTKEQYMEFVGVDKNFHEHTVSTHEESAFRKYIYPYISETVLDGLIASEEEAQQKISQLILKAAANYTFVKAFPSIKVKLSNYGVFKYEAEKTKAAEWYDYRDLFLSYVKTADESFSDALSEINKIDELKSQCAFFTEFSFEPIPTPEEFNRIYSINKSMEVYLNLVPLMRRAWQFGIQNQIKACSISDFSGNAELFALLKDAIAYSALGNALRFSQFTFLSSGIAIQYDEFPWQKTVILSEEAKTKLEEEFKKLSSESIGSLISYLKENSTDFPCYQPETAKAVREIIEKKSGLYL